MPYETYRLIHFFGIFLILVALGSATHHVIAGGTKQTDPFRRGIMITHGVGMLLVLLGGFGALAKLGIHGLPVWAICKLVIWLIFGGLIAVVYKKPQYARAIWFIIPMLALLSGIFAAFKPG